MSNDELKEQLNTKDKIIDVAGTLFAEHGYDSASVRDISQEAGVNVASINYHFKNKQNLYKEVMNTNMIKLEASIKSIASDSKDIQDFNWKIFCQFTENPKTFINSFKLFISNTLPEDEAFIPDACDCNTLVPPGFTPMKELLAKEVPANIDPIKLEWAVKAMFSYIAHNSLILCSTLGKLMISKNPFFSEEYKRQSLFMFTEAILNYLNKDADK
ncbi:TetR/AcrR family transcriptional regulator [Bacteriovorax sp. Seq25_V]|uniref:TetR/AcrR family transcriptional regulator n=1 Tax=Bacteriovorax sp. Seq25_V TaxID=1201288 RepID=UPI00038A0110|nr:TetR/AcrR family transcriptional regulator [Bacteriovorax sp. Seq25_V]EQC47236.1 transcriptional regulator, TetR family [Bacteriovorax sp. Seq25_V]